MKEFKSECESFLWTCIVLASVVFLPLALLKLTEVKPSREMPEPPILKLSDYPKTQEHCKICSQCRERWDLIEKNQVTWDSPVCCSEGFEIGMQEFRERWVKLNE